MGSLAASNKHQHDSRRCILIEVEEAQCSHLAWWRCGRRRQTFTPDSALGAEPPGYGASRQSSDVCGVAAMVLPL